MDGIPKIKKIKNSVVNLPNLNASIKSIIKTIQASRVIPGAFFIFPVQITPGKTEIRPKIRAQWIWTFNIVARYNIISRWNSAEKQKYKKIESRGSTCYGGTKWHLRKIKRMSHRTQPNRRSGRLWSSSVCCTNSATAISWRWRSSRTSLRSWCWPSSIEPEKSFPKRKGFFSWCFVRYVVD